MTAPVAPESVHARARRRRRRGAGRAGGPALIVSAVVAVLAIAFVAVLATREPATERRRDAAARQGRCPRWRARPSTAAASTSTTSGAAGWSSTSSPPGARRAGWSTPSWTPSTRRTGQPATPRWSACCSTTTRPSARRLLRAQRRRLAGGARQRRPIASDFGVVKVPETYLVDPQRPGGGQVHRRRHPGRARRRDRPDRAGRRRGGAGRGRVASPAGGPWARCLGVVLAVALSSASAGPGTTEERARALAETVACPQCDGQSVADSDSAGVARHPAADRDPHRRRARATTQIRDELAAA